MSREKEGFRENMSLLNERFSDKDMLTVTEAAEFMGVSRETCRKRIRFNAQTRQITKADLARQVTV